MDGVTPQKTNLVVLWTVLLQTHENSTLGIKYKNSTQPAYHLQIRFYIQDVAGL